MQMISCVAWGVTECFEEYDVNDTHRRHHISAHLSTCRSFCFFCLCWICTADKCKLWSVTASLICALLLHDDLHGCMFWMVDVVVASLHRRFAASCCSAWVLHWLVCADFCCFCHHIDVLLLYFFFFMQLKISWLANWPINRNVDWWMFDSTYIKTP